VNFSHILKLGILGCDKPTPLNESHPQDSDGLEKKFRNSTLNSSSLSFMILNGTMKLGASLTRTLKRRNLLIGNTLRYTKFPTSKHNSLRLWSAQLFCLECAIHRFSLTKRSCLSPSWNMSGLKPLVLQPNTKTMGFDTYDHIASQMVPSSNSLYSYCCRKNRHTVDSYPNFFCNAEHRLSA
jgi:hypothetical protein